MHASAWRRPGQPGRASRIDGPADILAAEFRRPGSEHDAEGRLRAYHDANRRGQWAIYAGFNFTDQDSSVTITPKTTTGSDAGLVFWATGPSDFYFFGVSDTAGTFGIYRHVAATGWQPIVPFMANPNVKTGAGAVNTLRLVSKGNLVSLFVNGQPIGKLQIQAPPAGGTVGIIGEGSAKNPWDYAYSDLSVSQ